MTHRSFRRFFVVSVQNFLPATCVGGITRKAVNTGIQRRRFAGTSVHDPATESVGVVFAAPPSLGLAAADTSLSVRKLQPGSCCHDGFVAVEQPPPAPLHTVSVQPRFTLLFASATCRRPRQPSRVAMGRPCRSRHLPTRRDRRRPAYRSRSRTRSCRCSRRHNCSKRCGRQASRPRLRLRRDR